MGEVWKARDTRLNRDVAIKFSTQQLSGRFGREARAIAALNHTNICTLYDIGPDLVMELVEGQTLAERIRRGAIPPEEALGIAKQIADALEAAHEKGIVHRDLKPANIKIRPDGSVKVLDFGLAKATEDAETAVDSPTVTMTRPGTVMGTPGYMSPEQVRGEKVDKLSDIWAFGVVLYEMVTGDQPFPGKTTSDTMAAVIKEEPDWTRAPATVQRMLRRCLEKDAKGRLRDIGDAMALLDYEAATTAPLRSRLGLVGWVAAVFALLATTVAFIHFREEPPPPQAPLRLQLVAPENAELNFQLSPNGRNVAFTGGRRLWVHSLDSGESRDLTASPGGTPFWSPDSRFIGYLASGNTLHLTTFL
jgi:serine/threonine protein kinase